MASTSSRFNTRKKGKFVSKAKKQKEEIVAKYVPSIKKKHISVHGRRIIDISCFVAMFDDGCQTCGKDLKFKNLFREGHFGLFSRFYFSCTDCDSETVIATSRTTGPTHLKRKGAYCVNTKAALAMIHAGIGETHVNAFMTTLGIPAISFKTIKKRERDIGPFIEKMAKKSCIKATADEKMITLKHMSINTTATPGWGHVIGFNTRRCLNISTRVKNCTKCRHYKRTGKASVSHDCRRNWTKSSKAMEADIAVQLHIEAKEHGVRYSAVIGDEDSSAIKQIHEKINFNVKKFSDFGHLKRTVSNKLQLLQKQHKSFTASVRTCFVKHFTYAVHRNKNGSESVMKSGLESIIPHMYGNHETCGEWCKFDKVEHYKHSSLPRGKDLTDVNLRKDLEDILSPYIKNPIKLTSTGDSQANESLNNTAWSKAPKIRNYNGSESFDFRCAAAVCQYNDGRKYVSDVWENAKLTPQNVSKRFAKRQDEFKDYIRMYKSERKNKRRRIGLKKERSDSQVCQEVREGVTYGTDCALDTEETLDVEEIPAPRAIHQIGYYDASNVTLYYDLETTTIRTSAEITQLSACVNNEYTFNNYVLPTATISTMAQQITGLNISVVDGVRKLFKNGREIRSTDLKTCLQAFIYWMKDIGTGKKILVAHNGKVFDMPIVLRALDNTGLMSAFKEETLGFVDSLPILKEVLPGHHSYKLATLYHYATGESFEAHDALEDVKALCYVLRAMPIGDKSIQRHSIQTESAYEYVLDQSRALQAFHVIETALCQGEAVISKSMAKKIARSGLTYSHILLAHKRDTKNGVHVLLSEKNWKCCASYKQKSDHQCNCTSL